MMGLKNRSQSSRVLLELTGVLRWFLFFCCFFVVVFFGVQEPINPYGRSKKMAEDVILDYAQSNKALAVTILR